MRQGVCRAARSAVAASAAKCNRGSVVASYSSVWFLIFSFVDFIMYCNIALWRELVSVAFVSLQYVGVCVCVCGCFQLSPLSPLSLSLLSTGCWCSNVHVFAVSLGIASIIDKYMKHPVSQMFEILILTLSHLMRVLAGCFAFFCTYVSFTYLHLIPILHFT